MVETEDLRRMHIDKGMSNGEIARATGMSRSAVAGRLGRAGIKNGKRRLNTKQTVQRTKKPGRLNFVFGGGESKPPERLPSEPTMQADFRSLNLLDLGDDDCRWPQGDGPFVFCGCPVRVRPYCSYHERTARPIYGRPVGT